MNNVPDRAKMRQEYVLNRATLNTLKTVGLIAMYSCGIAAVISAFASIACAIIILLFGGIPSVATMLADLFSSTVIFGAIWLLGKSGLHLAGESEGSLTYVPPVSEQIAMLPAEEVLLRGSQSLPASPEELLRPAGSEDTKREELLRASVGNES